jgi:hypothetical protein
LLVESGAKTSQEGWMKIGDDSMFGSPLLLAIWIENKFGKSKISEKIFQIIFNDNEKQYNSLLSKGKSIYSVKFSFVGLVNSS